MAPEPVDRPNTKSSKRTRCPANSFVWRVALFSSIGGVLTGFYVGSGNGLLEMRGFQNSFKDAFNLDDMGSQSGNASNSSRICGAGNGEDSDFILGFFVSSIGIGAIFGSLFGGTLSDRISRKYTLMVSGIVLALGAAVLASSIYYFWISIIGRSICGVALGIIYMVMPVYLSELTPKKTRGFFGAFIGPAYAIAALISLSANIGFSEFDLGWRVSNIITFLMALAYAIGMKWMPHTPRWLLTKQRDLEALAILKVINAHAHVDTRVDTFIELEYLRENSNTQVELLNSLKELFSKFKRRLVLCCILFTFEATTGTFIYYSSATIFCKVDFTPFVSSMIVSIIIAAASIFTVLLIDKVGRKAILLFCTVVDMLLGAIVGVLLHADAALMIGSVVNYIVLVLVCIYAFSYSLSWLTVTWVIAAEVYPVSIRGPAVAISTSIFWVFTFFMNQVTPPIIGSPIDLYGFFYITTGINIIALVFVVFALPKTKGVSLEDMENVFSESWRKRTQLRRRTTSDEKKVESSKEELNFYSDIKE